MIRLSGMTVREPDEPDGDIEIAFSGLRPGEKLFEELYFDEETAMDTPHPKIFAANPRSFDPQDVEAILFDLRSAVQNNEPTGRLLASLKDAIPEFQHYSAIVIETKAQDSASN
jgi:FlaA1/EpsC-like NDP-sugar epimerase